MDLKLSCPYCQASKPYERDIDPHIPSTVAVLQIVCPDCDTGDFNTETWFDAEGNEVAPE